MIQTAHLLSVKSSLGDSHTYPKKGPVTKIICGTKKPELVKKKVCPGNSTLIYKSKYKTIVR